MSDRATKEAVAAAVHEAALEMALDLHVHACTMTTQKAQGSAHWCADYIARMHGLDEDAVLRMAMRRVDQIVDDGNGRIRSAGDQA